MNRLLGFLLSEDSPLLLIKGFLCFAAEGFLNGNEVQGRRERTEAWVEKTRFLEFNPVSFTIGTGGELTPAALLSHRQVSPLMGDKSDE